MEGIGGGSGIVLFNTCELSVRELDGGALLLLTSGGKGGGGGGCLSTFACC